MIRAAASLIPRAIWSAVFALLISMRLLMPQGFMPAWDEGRFQISICDDAGVKIGKSAHDGHHKKDGPGHRQPCPYAAASQSFLSAPAGPIIEPPAPVPLAYANSWLTALPPHHKVERPPSRGPPGLT